MTKTEFLMFLEGEYPQNLLDQLKDTFSLAPKILCTAGEDGSEAIVDADNFTLESIANAFFDQCEEEMGAMSGPPANMYFSGVSDDYGEDDDED